MINDGKCKLYLLFSLIIAFKTRQIKAKITGISLILSMANLKRIYAAVNKETALYKLGASGKKRNSKYPKIAHSWEIN